MMRGILLLALVAGCQVQRTIGKGNGDGGAGHVSDLGDGEITFNLAPAKNKVDLLFMIDNSPSMAPKQAELKTRFPQLMAQLDAFGKTTPIDYHIGVVTSDLGAGQFDINHGQCHPGGDGGKLQAKGAAGDVSCAPLGNGLNFIQYNQKVLDGAGNPQSNLPPGETLAAAFGCMASVGDQGCGFEMQLESVYRALHDQIPENAGFLRDDAILVVLFVTDEDDCSADPNTDLFDPSAAGMNNYGALLSYRCTQFGIACDPQGASQGPATLMPYGDSGGPLSGCVPATQAQGSKLLDVSRYISFFTQPKANGGVKIDPNDVVLAAITAPEAPVQSVLANVKAPIGPYQICPGPVDPSGTGCAVVLQHSCVSAANTAFFGDPAVRIRAVVNAIANPARRQSTSVCDTSYMPSLDGLSQMVTTQLVGGCLGALPDPGNAQCTVEDVTLVSDGTVISVPLPTCSSNGGARPCWSITTSAQCGGARIAVDRGGAAAPPNTTTRARCLASS